MSTARTDAKSVSPRLFRAVQGQCVADGGGKTDRCGLRLRNLPLTLTLISLNGP